MITVIVPLYNAEMYVSKCIKSILKQSFRNFELILIDDCSTDNTLELCRKFQKKDDRIIIISKDRNSGVSNSRNLGIEKAKGKYLIFVDSDDFIDENMLAELYMNIKNTKSDISICSFEKVYSYEEKIINNDMKRIEILSMEEAIKGLYGKDKYQGFVWNKMYKKDIIDDHKIRFDEQITICEDLLFNIMYVSHINKAVYNTGKFYKYYQRDNSAYNGYYNKKWLTVLDAYKKIKKIIINKNINCIEEYNYNFLIANLDLKEKMTIAKMYKNDEKAMIANNIRIYLKKVLKQSYANKKEKLKLLVKSLLINLFIYLKRLKK